MSTPIEDEDAPPVPAMTNAEILGIAGAPGRTFLVQLPDGSFKEMGQVEYDNFEKMDAWQRLQWMNKQLAEAELAEYKALQAGGSDPRGNEPWDQAMRRLGRR